MESAWLWTNGLMIKWCTDTMQPCNPPYDATRTTAAKASVLIIVMMLLLSGARLRLRKACP